MGREVRLVPSNWEHPKENGQYKPLFGSTYEEEIQDWRDEKRKWDSGIYPEWASEKDKKLSYNEWAGNAPNPKNYMPQFKTEEKTHFMMYETTSEGTPISPAFETKEELARWLSDNGASAFAGMKATYDQWLSTINRGFACSAVISNGELKSGVARLVGQD